MAIHSGKIRQNVYETIAVRRLEPLAHRDKMGVMGKREGFTNGWHVRPGWISRGLDDL